VIERDRDREGGMEREKEMKQSKFKRICVFCGSSPGKKSSYRDAAIELGRELVMSFFKWLCFCSIWFFFPYSFQVSTWLSDKSCYCHEVFRVQANSCSKLSTTTAVFIGFLEFKHDFHIIPQLIFHEN
jgi:hypothetical protein